MNPEDMAKFIESLDDEQRKAFEKVFKSVGSSMGVEVKEEKQDAPANNVNEDFRVTNSKLERGRTPVRARKNQWVDEGEDRDPDFDPAKFERMGKAARNRSKARKKTIECHICGRSFAVNPAYVYGENVRCNRCTGR